MKMIFVLAALIMSTACVAKNTKEETKPAPVAKAHAFRGVATVDTQCSAEPGGMDAEYIEAKARDAKSCHEAYEAVKNCGFGSSIDAMTTGAAITTCEKFTNVLTKSDAALKATMYSRCRKICNPRTEGTLCTATISFCNLDVARFMNIVNSPNN